MTGTSAAPGQASASAVALLTVLALPGVGRATAPRLVAGTGGMATAEVPPALAEALASRGVNPRGAWDAASRVAQEAARVGIHVLGRDDPDFPGRLLSIPDAPCVLFAKGDVGALHADRSIAVVGTRSPTPFGAEVARRTAGTAAGAGFVVVSGLARGIDQAGHRGCLDKGGITVAVMAHGLDDVQPRSATDLAREMLARGGCLVSEYPPGVEAMAHRFIERDRLQAGLSDAVLVVETDLAGGTMHTVRAARRQGRALACLVHPERFLDAPQAAGNRKVLEEGAEGMRDGEDLKRFLAALGPSASLRAG